MSSQVQYRRGTNAQNAAFTGALAEITVDTTNGTLRVHDAITVGGSNIATVAYVTAQISALSANSITSGTSNFSIIASGGNIRGNVGGATVTNIYSGGMELTGLLSATGNVTGGNVLGGANVNATTHTGTTVSVTGNITGGNLLGTIRTAAQTSITSVGTLTSLSVTGNVTGGNLITAGLVSLSSITKTGSNGVGNIGAAASAFNTVFAKATSAQYADLAENYLADAAYVPGTVVEFGGNNEVTVSTMDHSTAVAGIVSTDPAYLMNSNLQGVYTVAVALIGRVPCRVQGPVKKGSVLVTSSVPGTAMAIDNLKFKPGCVVGKAMETIDSVDVKTIEVAVGRL